MNLLTESTEGIRASLAALAAHRLRFFLSTLGVVIGIVTVTLMAGAVEGIRVAFRRSVSALYTDVLFLERYAWFNDAPWWEFRENPKITIGEAEEIRIAAGFASEVVVEASADRDVTYRDRTAFSVGIAGSTEEIVSLRSIAVREGRFFSPVEVQTARRVCVLGPAVVDTLFPTGNALGEAVRIGGEQYEVIGTTDRLGQFFGKSLDYQLFIPLTRFRADIARHPELSVMLRVKQIDAMADARDELRGIVRKVRRLQVDQADNFAINEQEGALRSFRRTNATIAAVAMFVTGLSLVVGAIGITNIMYVSVRERTREIGLRKALGAKRRMILIQFLLEGLIICLLGGLVAIALAYGMSGYVRRFQAIEMSGAVLATSLGVAALTGLVAGLLPAIEAARMVPVEALRSD